MVQFPDRKDNESDGLLFRRGSFIFSYFTSNEGSNNAKRTENGENHKGRFHALQQVRMIFRSDGGSANIYGKYKCDDGHAEGLSDKAHGPHYSRCHAIEPFFNRTHDSVRIGRYKKGKPKTKEHQI